MTSIHRCASVSTTMQAFLAFILIACHVTHTSGQRWSFNGVDFCSLGVETVSETICKDTSLTNNDAFADITDCKKYYYCRGNNLVSETCALGLSFDNTIFQCTEENPLTCLNSCQVAESTQCNRQLPCKKDHKVLDIEDESCIGYYNCEHDEVTGLTQWVKNRCPRFLGQVYFSNGTCKGITPICSTECPHATTVAPTRQPEPTTESIEVTTQPEPDITTQGQDTTSLPVITTQEPEVTTQEPEVTTQQPVVTTQEPVVTTEEPVVTTEELVVTTQEPVVTTQEPVITTQTATDVQTEVPDVTTQKEDRTTIAPDTTTGNPPEDVTSQPMDPDLTTTEMPQSTIHPLDPCRLPNPCPLDVRLPDPGECESYLQCVYVQGSVNQTQWISGNCVLKTTRAVFDRRTMTCVAADTTVGVECEPACPTPTIPSTSTATTTDAITTVVPTTAEPITAEPITAGPITAGPITAGQTTAGQTTPGQTTAGQTTAGWTTAGWTTEEDNTTLEPELSTINPTTLNPTTEIPTTEAPMTESPTMESPTTESPTTESPTTVIPTTESPTTESPTTESPTTESPTTESPTTESPTTKSPTTKSSTTESPTTESPTTENPTTVNLSTENPTTLNPTTKAPTTVNPTTENPTTENPTTMNPTTDSPTTVNPTTENPTTVNPTTENPTTVNPTTVLADTTVTLQTDQPDTTTGIVWREVTSEQPTTRPDADTTLFMETTTIAIPDEVTTPAEKMTTQDATTVMDGETTPGMTSVQKPETTTPDLVTTQEPETTTPDVVTTKEADTTTEMQETTTEMQETTTLAAEVATTVEAPTSGVSSAVEQDTTPAFTVVEDSTTSRPVGPTTQEPVDGTTLVADGQTTAQLEESTLEEDVSSVATTDSLQTTELPSTVAAADETSGTTSSVDDTTTDFDHPSTSTASAPTTSGGHPTTTSASSITGGGRVTDVMSTLPPSLTSEPSSSHPVTTTPVPLVTGSTADPYDLSTLPPAGEETTQGDPSMTTALLTSTTTSQPPSDVFLRADTSQPKEAGNVTFECGWTPGWPPAGEVNVTWMLDDRPLSASRRIQIRKLPSSGKLLIDPVVPSDAGTVTCVLAIGESIFAKKLHTFQVRSLPVVTITPMAMTVVQGSDGSLTCRPTQGPPREPQGADKPNIEWYRDGRKLGPNDDERVSPGSGNSSRLTFTANQTVRYGCRAVNQAGTSQPAECLVTVIQTEDPVCPDETKSRLEWPTTAGDTMAMLPCPQPQIGVARRRCLQDGEEAEWEDVNLNQCVDPEYMELFNKVRLLEDLIFGITDEVLAELTQNLMNITSMPLTPGNLNISTLTGLKLGEVRAEQTQMVMPQQEHQDIVTVMSSLISTDNDESWSSITKEDEESCSSILHTVDMYGKVSARQQTQDNIITLMSDNLLVQVQSFYKNSTKTVKFPQMPDEAMDWMSTDTAISVQKETFDKMKDDVAGEMFSMSSSLYKDIERLLPNSSHRFAENMTTSFINSRVMALDIENMTDSLLLSPPVTANFSILQEQENFTGQCAFWNFSLHEAGGWDTRGCRRINNGSDDGDDDSMVMCECDHLTNFAILMSPNPMKDAHHFVLSILSIIGCVISIGGMVLTIMLYAAVWKHVKSHHAVVLINMCIALITANVLFIAGVDKVENEVVCTTIAALLHYFYLVAFFMMLVEGIELVLYTIYVFHHRRKRETAMLIFFAWFIPALIVGVSLGITKLEGYGNDQFCWLDVSSGLLWAFVGPVLAIIFINMCIIIAVLRRVSTSKVNGTVGGKKKHKVRSAMRNLLVIMPVMGVAWIFGVFMVSDGLANVIFQYIFVVANSLQGLFIFIFHALCNKKKGKYGSSKGSSKTTRLKSATSSKSKKSNSTSSPSPAPTPGIRGDEENAALFSDIHTKVPNDYSVYPNYSGTPNGGSHNHGRGSESTLSIGSSNSSSSNGVGMTVNNVPGSHSIGYSNPTFSTFEKPEPVSERDVQIDTRNLDFRERINSDQDVVYNPSTGTFKAEASNNKYTKNNDKNTDKNNEKNNEKTNNSKAADATKPRLTSKSSVVSTTSC